MEAAAKASDQTVSEWVRGASQAILKSRQAVEETNKLIESSQQLLSGGRRK